MLNPELVISHLDSKATMQIDITINKGRGYVPADENREYCTDFNVIPIDSIYTPVSYTHLDVYKRQSNSRLFDEVAERYSSKAQSCRSSRFKFEKRNH